MIDPITLSLIAGGVGALTSKKPLKGALMGAGLGYGGGLLAGGMAGAGAGAGGAGIGGLLGNPVTAATYGTGLGTEQTAMLAAQEAGMGFAPTSTGLLGDAVQLSKDAAPALNAVSTGMQIAGAGQQPPVQAPAPMVGQGGPQGLSGLLQSIQQSQAAQMQAEEQKRAARREAYRGGVM